MAQLAKPPLKIAEIAYGCWPSRGVSQRMEDLCLLVSVNSAFPIKTNLTRNKRVIVYNQRKREGWERHRAGPQSRAGPLSDTRDTTVVTAEEEDQC